MTASSTLPQPSPEAIEHSLALAELIAAEIAAAGGWIPFTRYMELALYAPGFGYYAAGSAKFGSAGDFVTAPQISRLFGQTLARQAAQVLRATGGDLLEIGAGTGRLATDLLSELERLGALPRHYCILEVSPDLRDRQAALLREAVPELAGRVRWLEHLPHDFTGLVMANEVLDAMPCHLVAWRAEGVFERGLAVEGGRFAWRERPAEGELKSVAAAIAVPTGYVSEISLAARGFVKSFGARLARGVLLLIDYGFGAGEYYHPQRSAGTLMCHYRHHAHDDPFWLPGLQDITAHVDFSAVALAARSVGLDLLGYTSQASFLVNCGITEVLSQTPADDAAAYLPLASQAQKLLSLAEMGELFKVFAAGRGIAEPLLGFSRGGLSRML